MVTVRLHVTGTRHSTPMIDAGSMNTLVTNGPLAIGGTDPPLNAILKTPLDGPSVVNGGSQDDAAAQKPRGSSVLVVLGLEVTPN